MTQPILAVEKLSASYEGESLLEDINFTLDDGEILCLLGPSGSGKTTLLRIIAGLEQADRGKILFRNKDIASIPPHRRRFGMMFQEYALFPHKNVWDNIAFGLEMQKIAAPARDTRITEMLSLVDLQHFGRRRIDELSGGERQRVALARSLAPFPELLLLDEPLGSLDRALRDRLTLEIRAILKKIGVTAIFVTHDQTEAFSIADRIAVLGSGTLLQLDSPEKLYRLPISRQIAAFLGFHNFIAGKRTADTVFDTAISEFSLPPQLDAGQESSQLLIRPENCSLEKTPQLNFIAIHGILVNKTFQGGYYRLTVDAGAQLLIFHVPNYPSPPEPKDPITVFIPQANLVLINN